MPFSRSLRLSENEAGTLAATYRECMDQGGILLVQPEHVLSFQLMGLESLINGNPTLGKQLLDMQHFFDTRCRDLVDESDENFSVKFELIYTMGTQRPVELSPERWTLIHALLGIVADIAPHVYASLPQSIEFGYAEVGRFPRTRLLRSDAHDLLLKLLGERIRASSLPGLPIFRQPSRVQDAVLKYIMQQDLSDAEILAVEKDSAFWTESTKQPLLLLRGLMAGGVLGFALSHKRWRVNYGVDPDRRPKTELALPFRAKDSPTPRSEFSHPDVIIIFTCLSYYYGGLEDEQLFRAFDHLMKSDQATAAYQDWVADAPTLPPSFRSLVGINLKDRFQCTQHVFPHLRRAKRAIDYFLSYIVFPKEVKEFPKKLSASGWDIGRTKRHPVTGFSGTNDSKHLLPLSVAHLDLETQRHTNALVLENLLRPENRVHCVRPHPATASPDDARRLLTMVTDANPDVQVIIDVGAQVLELSNLQFAQAWLAQTRDSAVKQAAVFFNEHDEMCVVTRDGYVEPLQASPFSSQLDLCVIFLDEAHTRGTDLKLPDYYRAAVTLGANLTKDRLIQGG